MPANSPVSACLNCRLPVSGNYCHNCGQKTSTHRFSLHHIGHDLMHGMFHVDKGILFTLKELFTRPGFSVREYVAGKRAQHFNYFTLLLLLIAFSAFIDGIGQLKISQIVESTKKLSAFADFENFAAKYPKLVILSMIPFYALSTWIFFRKARQYFAEHLVLNAYRACGELIISMLLSVAAIFTKDATILKPVYSVVIVLVMLYNVIFYWQYFYPDYRNKKLLILRSVFAAYVFNSLMMIIGMILYVLYMTPNR